MEKMIEELPKVLAEDEKIKLKEEIEKLTNVDETKNIKKEETLKRTRHDISKFTYKGEPVHPYDNREDYTPYLDKPSKSKAGVRTPLRKDLEDLEDLEIKEFEEMERKKLENKKREELEKEKKFNLKKWLIKLMD